MTRETNEERPLFSIFVPIYNAEKYLEECLESVVAQNFASWELILVDDGSTDSSGDICDAYAKKDVRIRVVHKENGGEFSSRYAAMQVAAGIYATGLDADDKYAPDYLERISKEIHEGDYDCVKWSFTFFEERIGIDKLPENAIGKYKDTEYLEFIVKTTLHSFCSQAIKLDLLKKVDYSSVPKVRMSEDYIMVIPALCYVKSAKVIDYYGYMYRVHGNSTSNSVNFQKIYDLCEVSKYGLEVMKKAGVLCDKIESGEHLAFLKCTWPRIEIALRNNKLTIDEIQKIWRHCSYVDSLQEETIANFKGKVFIKMKLFRNRRLRLLKLIIAM